MISGEIITGQARAWKLVKKLGEGDAGEVFLVEALLEKQIAVLKRPLHTAFPSDIIRQATQIQREASFLEVFSTVDQQDWIVRPPVLLDRSKSGTEYTDHYFIITSRATGIDLQSLAREIHLGKNHDKPDAVTLDLSAEQYSILDQLIAKEKIPDLVLLRVFKGFVEFLESIHSLEIINSSSHYYGVLWNDVKPDHFFWDIKQPYFTIIDWGNGQYLEADGITKDRQHSRNDDFYQFLTEMGRFVEEFSPDLFTRLNWPQDFDLINIYSTAVVPLKEKINASLADSITSLQLFRRRESEILQFSSPDLSHFSELEHIQDQIIGLGELPDYRNTENFLMNLSKQLIANGQLSEFIQITERLSLINSLKPEKWNLLKQIACVNEIHNTVETIISHGLRDDWASTLWELHSNTLDVIESPWWEDLRDQIRDLQLGPATLLPRPYVALNRLIHALQVELLNSLKAPLKSPVPKSDHIPSYSPQMEELSRVLKEEILPMWTHREPNPPYSGIEYKEIEQFFDSIIDLMPKAGHALIQSLEQPRALTKIALDAWERKDISTVRKALRNILLWDPDRCRLITADQAVQTTTGWLQEVRRGPQKDEPLIDFVTRLGLNGRDIRNKVAGAEWLDGLLQALAELRKGAEPTQVMLQHPNLRDEIGWLLELEPRRPILATKPVKLAREPVAKVYEPTLFGIREARLGLNQDMRLSDPLDTWAPEALGSSARVFSGFLRNPSGHLQQVAIKIMRQGRTEYALPLFREEIQILSLLKDVPGVSSYFECGLIKFPKSLMLPPEEKSATANALEGELVRYGSDSIHNLIADLENKVSQDWLPYLALEKRDRSECLMLLCDVGYTRGRFLPILEGLCMAIQLCDIIEAAHARNIVYRDHKILHYYWQEGQNGIFVIDWNIAKRYPAGLSKSDAQFDLVQFSARALHHILTGRPAPGTLPLGPTRPEEIETAAHSYSVQWTYDDQRLPQELKDILEKALAGNYNSAKQLREDLNQSFKNLSQLMIVQD